MFDENPCLSNELFRKKIEMIFVILNDGKHGNEKITLKRLSRKMPLIFQAMKSLFVSENDL